MESKLISLVVTNLAGSGAEKVVLNLFNMFEKFGHNVYIFLLEDLILYNLSEDEKNKALAACKKISDLLYQKFGIANYQG